MMSHEVFHGPPVPQPERELEENDIEDQESTISPISWVQRQMLSGIDPRLVLDDLLPKSSFIPQNVSDIMLWRLIVNLLTEPKRTKLTHINTLDDAVNLLKTCKNIVVLTGAGVSVSCGIPDFRSRNGIYARLSKDYPGLPDPQAMFDIHYFRKDPRPFFKFAKEIYPGQFEASPSHRFIKLLETQDKLLRNYTQNIDTLEHATGIQNVITCHGSFASATCTICGYKVDSLVIKDDIVNQRIPYCPICPSDLVNRGIMKPDIVFFGEGLSDEFHEAMARDKDVCDLLIVIGSSLKVRPVAMIPSSIPINVPQILINREPLKHLQFDIELLGDCDIIIGELCRRLENDWVIDENIPRRQLREIVLPALPKCNLQNQSEAHSLDMPSSTLLEMNNNFDSSQGEINGGPSSLPPSEESNSCDFRGLSAIKLDDSEDGSNQEQPCVESSTSKEDELKPENASDYNMAWPSPSKEDLTKQIKDQSYIFIAPNRYIFQGAEIYKDSEDEDCCSTPTDYSSDSDSPLRPPVEDGNIDLSGRNISLQNLCDPLQPACDPQQAVNEEVTSSERQQDSLNT